MATIIREDKLKGSTEGSSRFSQIIKHTGLKYGHKDLPMNTWTIDGSNGATYTADYGTDGQQQHPIMAFAHNSDDLMYNRFMVPPDYKPGGTMELLVWFYADDTNPALHAAFDAKVRIIPTTSALKASDDHTSNVAIDGAGTGVVADNEPYVDDTPGQVKCMVMDLTNGNAQAYDPFDFVLLEVMQDSSEDTLGATVTVCHACLVYER